MPQVMNKTCLVFNLLNNEQKKERKEEKGIKRRAKDSLEK